MAMPDGNYQLLDGAWVRGEEAEFPVVDKYTLEPVASVAAASQSQAAAMVESAFAALRRGSPPASERGAILLRAAALVGRLREELVVSLRREAGFTRADAESEMNHCISVFEDAAASALGDSARAGIGPFQSDRARPPSLGPSMTRRVVAALTPSNSPLAVPAECIAAAFAAGAPSILAPAAATPLATCRLAGILLDAGLPRGFLSVLHGAVAPLRALASDSRIDLLDRSSHAEVAAPSPRPGGAATPLAFMILCEGADLEIALPRVIDSGYRRAGQAWTSVQILLVQAALLEDVQVRLARLVHALKFGDPSKPETAVGPLICEREAIRVEIGIEEAVARGAVRLAGGPRRGAVVPPTLLKNIDCFMKLGYAEIFGPVVCLQPFRSLEDAIGRVGAAPRGHVTALFAGRPGDIARVSEQVAVGQIYLGGTPYPQPHAGDPGRPARSPSASYRPAVH